MVHNIWVLNLDNNRGTLKVWWDVIFHNTPTLSPTNEIGYLPLWEHINFPDHLNMDNSPSAPPHAIGEHLNLWHTHKSVCTNTLNLYMSFDLTKIPQSYC